MRENLTDPTCKMNVAAIIIAAGYSSRMESFKPLLEIGGKTAIIHLIDAINSAGIKKIFVIVGHNADKITCALESYADGDKDIEYQKENAISKNKCSGGQIVSVYNEKYNDGMFSSVKTGLIKVSEDDTVESALLFPVDIPLVSKNTIEGLVREYDKRGRPACFCLPKVMGKNGHPLLIPRKFFSEIINYSGDGGLKAVRNKYDENMICFDTDDEGALLDMDKPEDYIKLVNYYESKR